MLCCLRVIDLRSRVPSVDAEGRKQLPNPNPKIPAPASHGFKHGCVYVYIYTDTYTDTDIDIDIFQDPSQSHYTLVKPRFSLKLAKP